MMFFQIDRFVAIMGMTILTCLTGGCGGNPDARPEVEISGVVTLDGAALQQGSIHFRSSKTGESAYVNLGSDGHYSLIFPEADLGSEYNVTVGLTVIEDQDPLEMMDKKLVPKLKKIIPERYSKLETSGLKVKIEQAGNNEFNFELTNK